MKTLSSIVALVAVACFSSHARAQVAQAGDAEEPPVVVSGSSSAGAGAIGDGHTTLSATLVDGLPGFEYSRRVAPHLELTFGFNSLGAVAWTPSAGVRVRAFERRRWTPYVYGRVAHMFNPGFMDLQLASGGLGVQWRHGARGVVFVQAGAAAARDVDREDDDDYVGDWGVVPDVMVGYGLRL